LHCVSGEWFIINGQINPTLTVVAGSSTWLRFVNAIGGYTPTLYVSNQATSRVVSTTCSVTIIAKDGVFLQSPRAATSINSSVSIWCCSAQLLARTTSAMISRSSATLFSRLW
jgi:FtsP/CotA-like multicopper oxidase with cupredoxin domain